MSASAAPNPAASHPSPAARPVPLRTIGLLWLLVCLVFVARTLFAGNMMPLISDTDDAMRLVVVRDFLAGQNWFDHVQYRLNVPFGAEIHWSRLPDVPIAGLILLFRPFLGDNAIFAAAWIWPLILLFFLLWLSVRMTVYLVGPDGALPGFVLPILSAAILVEFAPGRVDHHSIQIILTLALVYASIRAWREKAWAWGAGIAAATSMAIAMEALPQIIVAVALFGLFYVLDDSRKATMRAFGLAFGGATFVHLVLALPPSRWTQTACDALSSTYALAAGGVALVFLILSFLPLKSPLARLLAGGAMGAVLVGALLRAFPQCSAGPYGQLDPWLLKNWIGQIVEAKPVWYSLEAIPAYTLGIIVPPLIALGVTVWIMVRTPSEKPVQWAILAAYLLAGILVMLVQVRGARLVAGLVGPAGAWAIIRARQAYLDRASLLSVTRLVATWLAFAGLVISALAGFVLPTSPNGTSGSGAGQEQAGNYPADGTRYTCLQPREFVDIASIPPERVMAPVDLGSHLLLFTPHSVVGAPYHRNQDGVLDTFRFFNKSQSVAHDIARSRGISLVVTCPYMAEMKGFADAAPDSLVRMLQRGELPDWLVDYTLPGAALRVYGVVNRDNSQSADGSAAEAR